MSERRPIIKRVAVAAGAAVALAGAFQAGRSVEHKPIKPRVIEVISPHELDPAGVITEQLRLREPIKYLNGSLAEETKEGTKVHPNPIVVYTGNTKVHGRLDTANFRYFTANHKNGVPTVIEIEVKPGMHILGPEKATDPLTLDAILDPYTPAPGESDQFADAYAVSTYPERAYKAYIGGPGKGGALFVATGEVLVAPRHG